MSGLVETLAFLSAPLQFPFMQQALLISVLIAVPMAMLSCFLVLKGWSLMGDAISHAVLPGIVLAYIAGLPLLVGAFAAGVFCAVATGYLKDNSRVKEDTVMGVVFSGMFGLGLVLYLATPTDVHLDHILFGNMLGVTWGDVVESGFMAAFCAALIFLLRHDLLLHAFDVQHAQAVGLPVRLLHYGFLALLSLAVVAALKAVGIILSIAMLVAPGAIAFLLTRRFREMMAVAVAIALFSSALGVYVSFFLDSAPAPTIVLIMTIMFVAVFVWQQFLLACRRRENAATNQ